MSFKSLCISMAIVAWGVYSHGEHMDLQTHTLLIDKLERVLEVLDTDSEKKTDIMLRLADLHAERGRLEDLEQGKVDADKNSASAKEDRDRALELYQDAGSKASPAVRGKINMQMAQLYDLNGDYAKAHKLYTDVAQNKDGQYSSEYVGVALTKLGDISFNKIKYDEAEKFFKRALDINETPRKDYINYRLAWCEFHKGRRDVATNHLFTTLQKSAGSPDTSFLEEASHDLATFMAQGHVGPKEVQQLSDVSPLNVRHQNLTYLADELNRLGKKSAALYVITVAGPEKDPNRDEDEGRDKIESHLKIAEIQYDIGKKDLTSQEITKTVEQWQAEPCKVAENCELLRQRLKKLIVGWGKAEEKHPSKALVTAYGQYNALFPEAEMNYWAALAARQNGLYKEAAQFYRNASDLALKNSAPASKGDTKIKNIIEGSLLGEIEVAELAHDIGLRTQAYSHYLEANSKGDKAFEVRYQQAHLLYEQSQYHEAAIRFHALALEGGFTPHSKDIGLAKKSAHLSLDSLVLAKEDNQINPWAKEYANEFHQDKSEFLKIAKKAVMNRVVRIINDPASTSDQYREALNILSSYPIKDANKEEKAAYYKDRLILGEKLQDLELCKESIAGLLAIKNLKNEDRAYALSRLEWIDELQLHFNEAYSLALGLPFQGTTKDERHLKLAMLAELAGKSPVRHYEDFLRTSNAQDKKQTVAAKMIRYSHSEKMLLQHEGLFANNRELLATLALEIFAIHKDFKFAQKVLGVSGLWQTASGHVLSRFLFLRSYHVFSEELAHSHLSQRRISKANLDNYLRLLKKTESLVSKAVASQDWVLQVITLSDVAYHYKRFAVELFGMKVPPQFEGELSQQARQYQYKGLEVSRKVAELWKDSSARDALFEDYSKTHGELKKALFDELRQVAKVAPATERRSFIQAVARAEQKPSLRLVEAAEISVSRSPFDSAKIENLKSLEEKAGHETLVAFLDARLLQIQKGSKQ